LGLGSIKNPTNKDVNSLKNSTNKHVNFEELIWFLEELGSFKNPANKDVNSLKNSINKDVNSLKNLSSSPFYYQDVASKTT
jgi:hypothetical protein